jgi:hypothetical protein
MGKRFWISVAVMFLLLTAFGYLVHGVLLMGDYARLSSLYRSPEEQLRHFAWIPLANLLTAFVFVWVYRRGQEDSPPVAQGLRYGLAVAALVTIPRFLTYYSIQPVPGGLVSRQILYDTTMFVLMGVVLAFLNQRDGAGDRPAPARRP